MLPALAVALSLAAAPSEVSLGGAPRHAHLVFVSALTTEQIAEAPLDSLSLAQLRQEDARLAEPPSLTGPIVMISAGAAMLTFGSLATYLLFANTSGAGFGAIILVLFGIVTAAVAIAGAALAIAGTVMLPSRLAERDRYAARREQVQGRIAAITSGQVQEPVQERGAEAERVQNQINQLELERPSLGLPIGLLAAGGGVTLYSLYYWQVSNQGSTSNTSTVAIWVAGLVSGLILDGIGTWLLIDRLRTRADIDEKIKALQAPHFAPGGETAPPGAPPPPPPGESIPGGEPVAPPPPPLPPQAQLPPAPVLFAFGWRF